MPWQVLGCIIDLVSYYSERFLGIIGEGAAERGSAVSGAKLDKHA